MHGVAARAATAQQQGGRGKGAIAHAVSRRRVAVHLATDDVAFLGQGAHAGAQFAALCLRCQRSHLHACLGRVADHHGRQAFAQARRQRFDLPVRHHHAADGGAVLARLDRHRTHDGVDQQLEFRLAAAHVRSQDGAVQRRRAQADLHRARQQVGVVAQGRGGGVRTREADGIVVLQPCQQGIGRADGQLQRAFRQHA
ncbi:hypothetical protein D3C72_1512850 [compost metagenome]